MIEIRGADGGIYKRASLDKAAGTQMEGMSVEGQEEEARERADELGVNIVAVYNDNNLSSSEFRQKERKDWPRMLADIEAGRLKVIIMWDTSRGSRDLEDWVKFLKLIAKHGVLVHAVSHERTYNPQNHRDWEVLAQDGVKNAAFSKQLSANVKRGYRRSARAGRPRGVPAFAWKRVYDPDSGKMTTQESVKEMEKYVVEIFDRFVSGTARNALAVELNWRNRAPEDHPNWFPLSRDGKPWRHNSLTKILRNPVYIGKLRDRATGELLEGNWDGFIDETTWWSAQRLMDATTTSRDPRARYLLTRIARCGRCGSRMSVAAQTYYICSGKGEDDEPLPTGAGCTSMKVAWLDEVVFDLLADRLCKRRLIEKLTEADSEHQKEAWRRAKELKSQLDDAWSKVYEHVPGYSHDRVAQMEAVWGPEIQRLEEEAAAGLDSGRAIALSLYHMAKAAGVEGEELKELLLVAVRDETPLPGQRALVRTLFDSIRILPAARPNGRRAGGKKFDPTRIEIDGERVQPPTGH